MAKKAKKKSGFSDSDRKEGCFVRGKVGPKSREKNDAKEESQKEIFTALIEQLNDQTPGIILRAQNLWRAAASRPSKEFAGRDDLTASP